MSLSVPVLAAEGFLSPDLGAFSQPRRTTRVLGCRQQEHVDILARRPLSAGVAALRSRLAAVVIECLAHSRGRRRDRALHHSLSLQ
jgi:hypothetical protein